MKLYDQSQLLVGCNKCSYTGSVLEGATHSAYCFLTTDLKFLIILSLNLCFVSESNGDRKHEQSRHTGCQHTQVQAGTLWYSGRWTEASTEPAAAPGREHRLSPQGRHQVQQPEVGLPIHLQTHPYSSCQNQLSSLSAPRNSLAPSEAINFVSKLLQNKTVHKTL